MADCHRATERRIRAGEKRQHHSVTGRNAHQLAGRFGHAKLLRFPRGSVKRLLLLALLARQQLGIPDNVDKKDVPDLEPNLFLFVVRHDQF